MRPKLSKGYLFVILTLVMQIDKEIKEKNGDKYKGFSDEELVKMIVAEPHNEEAALFLIYVKYRPLFWRMCREYVKDMHWFDYCLGDVFISLRGSKGDWHVLANFGWTCTLTAYLEGLAENNFLRIKRLIDGKVDVEDAPIDNGERGSKAVQVVGGDEADIERRMELVLLLEAVQTLPSDQKFVILKVFEGHSSKEIAAMLQKKWEIEGVKKYVRSGKNKGELVVPSEAYVNNLKSHAVDELRKKLGENRIHD